MWSAATATTCCGKDPFPTTIAIIRKEMMRPVGEKGQKCKVEKAFKEISKIADPSSVLVPVINQLKEAVVDLKKMMTPQEPLHSDISALK